MQPNINNLIQRCLPNFNTPYGEMIAPSPIPIPAIASAIPKPARPASGSNGSLNVLRSNSNAISVSAVMPLRCIATAVMPRNVSGCNFNIFNPSRISLNPWLSYGCSCGSGPISIFSNRKHDNAATVNPKDASKITIASAKSAP